jgi:hypothetical protein
MIYQREGLLSASGYMERKDEISLEKNVVFYLCTKVRPEAKSKRFGQNGGLILR